MQIHQGRCNAFKALQAKNQTSSRIQLTQTVAAEQETKANAQEHYCSNPTDYGQSNRLWTIQPTMVKFYFNHTQRFIFNRTKLKLNQDLKII